MRRTMTVAILLAALWLTPRAALAQAGAMQGFGGLTLSEAASRPAFGGSVAVNVTPNIQVIGEVGRMSDVLPSTVDRLLAFTPFDLRVSALYGEGGVRFITAPHSPVKPYVEATAGIARLRTGFSGAGDRFDDVINAGLGFLDRTEPVLGAGGGIVVQGGPLFVDLGYRYKKILVDDPLQEIFASGDGIGVNQVRVGVGFSF